MLLQKLPIVVIQKFCYYGNVTSHFSSLLVFLIHIRWIVINPVGSTLQGLNNQDLVVMDGIAEGNEKDLSGCKKDVLLMLNSTIIKNVCRND